MFIFILKGMQKLEQLSVFGGILIISSLVVVPLMGVETALAALKVSQSPYRGAPVIVVVNTKFIWAFYRDQEKHLLVEVCHTQSGAPIAHMMHNNIFKFNFLSI